MPVESDETIGLVQHCDIIMTFLRLHVDCQNKNFKFDMNVCAMHFKDFCNMN